MTSDNDDRAESGDEFDCDSDDGAALSASFWSESERADRSFAPMPERLALPLELHRLIIYHSNEFEDMWGNWRLVCAFWRDEVEHLAKTEWIRQVDFRYNLGKLNGNFHFQRLEEDEAIFAAYKRAMSYHSSLTNAMRRCGPPAVKLGFIIHDIPTPELSFDYVNLTLTCPWRAVIRRVLGEELRVQAQCAVDDSGKNYEDACVVVRRERMGRADRRGDEWLKAERFAELCRSMSVS
ncbi:hypothetical protein R3P38DRAFT_2882832 [Favolaschia claudopus]|uniref:F-box domain-containing protein n=1 Tax=Favolaschia claudopus TaxID=2862362 RepID=A0AAW0CZB6_9AGAR